MVKLYRFLVLGLVMVLCFSFVYSMGCCVSPGLDICSANTQQEYCDATGGQFYSNDPSCSSVQVCTLGCCVIGLDASSMTLGKCQLQSLQMGAPSVNFIQTNGDCSQYVSSQEAGACVGVNVYGQKICAYVARTQCYGQFFPGVLCSDADNSVCNKTTTSVCQDNNAYFVDSCGNRDALKESCDYTKGEICKIVSADGMQEAKCQDQSCIDDFNYNPFVINRTGTYVTTPHYTSPVRREHGEVWCVTQGMVPFNASNLDINFNKLPLGQTETYSNTIDSAYGLRFFSRTCIDGQIITESCDDIKEGYCSGSSWWYDLNSSVGTGGTCRSNEYRDCLSATEEDDCDLVNCFWYDPVEIETIDPESVAILNMAKCLPRVPGGILDSLSKSSVCSEGDFEFTLSEPETYYPYLESGKWLVNVFTGAGGKGETAFLPINPYVVNYLDYRCGRIADCTGKMNWRGVDGNSSGSGIEYKTPAEVDAEIHKAYWPDHDSGDGLFGTGLWASGETTWYPFTLQILSDSSGINLASYDKLPVYYGDTSKSSFEYKCVPTKAPKNQTCGACSTDGTPCTEYKCKTIGRECVYYDAGGLNGDGVCMQSDDYVPPQITINCPASSSIKAQQPINISVGTSESSYCRFNLGSALASYDVMPYDLGTTWGLSHTTILAVPGMNQVKVGNATQYPLLTKSGNYSMFVRCIDPAGNGDTTPAATCNFVVPKTPDNNPAVILRYTPATNSPILYNSSVQNVKILVNEPAECKWSLKDADYDFMNNSFSCSSQLTIDKDISGYECSTLMTNISKAVGAKTTFYIKCEDQPELEGNETAEYHRNKNPSSSIYYLVGSDKLNITEITPQSKLTVGKSFTNWTLTAKTRGGGYLGEATCKWRLSFKNQNTSYSEFMNTGGTVHTQTITQIAEGDYILDVKCMDKTGNVANVTGPLQIRYDMDAPWMGRVYNDKGYMKIVTNELSICKFTNSFGLGFGCGFDFNDINLTLMTSSNSLSHNANWKKGISYFIKCQDFYGNLNNGCTVVSFGV